MRALVLIDLPDPDPADETTATDVAQALVARLDEIHLADGPLLPARVTAVVDSDAVIAHVIDAADVALDTDTVTGDAQAEAFLATAHLWAHCNRPDRVLSSGGGSAATWPLPGERPRT